MAVEKSIKNLYFFSLRPFEDEVNPWVDLRQSLEKKLCEIMKGKIEFGSLVLSHVRRNFDCLITFSFMCLKIRGCIFFENST